MASSSVLPQSALRKSNRPSVVGLCRTRLHEAMQAPTFDHLHYGVEV